MALLMQKTESYGNGNPMTSQAMVKLADELEITMRHARIFITSREKMHPVGVPMWDKTVADSIAALRLAAPPLPADGVRAGFKPIYVKRWRTLILVPESLADEMRDAFAALAAPHEQGER